MAKRKIINIDESKCNGCGLCVPNCQEGALKIVNGKARLVSEVFCDGLGACLGHCPQGAITIEEREAKAFDEKKVKDHLAASKPLECGCPGTKVMQFKKAHPVPLASLGYGAGSPKQAAQSQLNQWPVQIKLVPAHAPYLQDADLLIVGDCVPFAYADFHEELLKGKVLLVGCPKLDDAEYYKEKVADIFKHNNIKSITCVHMEVPCCFGLINIAKEALGISGKNIPIKEITIGIQGDIKK
ncbi:MAG: 4Fe-4S binding protein [Candidatus Omnitrophota bacterium]